MGIVNIIVRGDLEFSKFFNGHAAERGSLFFVLIIGMDFIAADGSLRLRLGGLGFVLARPPSEVVSAGRRNCTLAVVVHLRVLSILFVRHLNFSLLGLGWEGLATRNRGLLSDRSSLSGGSLLDRNALLDSLCGRGLDRLLRLLARAGLDVRLLSPGCLLDFLEEAL